MSAMKLCLDRIVPPLRASSERVVIGIEGTAAEKADKIINELGAGKISTEIAKDFLQVLLTQLDIFESSALCQKVDALEAIIMKRKTP
jgi:polyhydroxyalkanoate synthesis regulator phasin